ncbi:aldehyde dehydrogenase (NADP(+)) [Sphingobacterium corticibacter]|uniref:Aldehyde dehydrogenase (NADP(+)) n=1 Tax=Sphingobacterium corticibacter TaxID=2171749 RepID=A0A2T8HP61_9SPHI|nr:aldehyde dehydrogenase (NADP(+)) [Sphingobacterium corticibacter]PVH27102.1 aldehyde dehydrogenase (NADP(+)) [Sphingobacterium corticibacter]
MDQTKEILDAYVQKAVDAFQFLKRTTVQERAALMHAVADAIEALDDQLLNLAHEESALPMPRLQGEKARTVGQWRSYGDAVAKGTYLDARIDRADAEKGKNDIRKYSIGLGPVLVFGASNFPFAFSTAGGDTASAIGAGCPVLVKAHPGHPKTSQLMADTISKAVKKFGWPEGVFGHVAGDRVAGTQTLLGAYLTAHPGIQAVGFTGSQQGGKALVAVAAGREVPIPVFAEMGSVNPVFALPQLLEKNAAELAQQYVGSLTLGTGQFCTNPGIVVALAGAAFDRFKEAVQEAIAEAKPTAMLHSGIAKNYAEKKQTATAHEDVTVLAQSATDADASQGQPTVAWTSGRAFLSDAQLSEEVFGPFALLVEAESTEQLLAIAKSLEGQLTATVAATEEDLEANAALVSILQDKVGRLLFNGMPTGVEVVYAMQHGGPFPATSDPRFTSVGPDAVKRFVRPIAFQNWPENSLPAELKSSNPLQLTRVVDGVYTAAAL